MQCNAQNQKNTMSTNTEHQIEKSFEGIKQEYQIAAKNLLQNDNSLSSTQKERLSLIASRHTSTIS